MFILGLPARGSGVEFDMRAPQSQEGDWKWSLRGRNRTLPDLLCKTKNIEGTSLVAQWIGVPLPMQGTRLRSLVWEDSTCHGVTKAACHNF